MKHSLTNILNRIGKFARTDMHYVASGGKWLAIEQAISVVISFGLTIAFANLIAPEIYGQYKFILSGFGILGAFTLTGLQATVIQSVSRGHDRSLQDGVKTQLIWSVLPVIISVGVAIYYFINGNTLLGTCFLLMTVGLSIYKSVDLFDAFLVGKKMFKIKTTYAFFQNIAYVLSMFLVILLTTDVRIMIAVYLAVWTLTSLFFYWKTKKMMVLESPKDTQLASNAKHLSILSGLGRLAQEVDKVLIFHFLGPIQLALYAFALVPVARIDSMSSILKNLAAPKLSTHSIEAIKKTIARKICILMTGLMGIIIVYWFAAPYFFDIFFPQYADAIMLSRVFSFSILFSIPSLLLSQIFVAHMKKKELYITRISLPLIKIAFIAIFIPLFGLWGAILSLLATYVCHFGILCVLVYRVKD